MIFYVQIKNVHLDTSNQMITSYLSRKRHWRLRNYRRWLLNCRWGYYCWRNRSRSQRHCHRRPKGQWQGLRSTPIFFFELCRVRKWLLRGYVFYSRRDVRLWWWGGQSNPSLALFQLSLFYQVQLCCEFIP